MAAVTIWAFLPGSGRTRSAALTLLASSFAYLMLGMATRFVVHHRSRWQIVVLLAVVALVEAVRARRNDRPMRLGTWAAGSAAVCLGVLVAEWALEPGVFSDMLARLQNDQAMIERDPGTVRPPRSTSADQTSRKLDDAA